MRRRIHAGNRLEHNETDARSQASTPIDLHHMLTSINLRLRTPYFLQTHHRPLLWQLHGIPCVTALECPSGPPTNFVPPHRRCSLRARSAALQRPGIACRRTRSKCLPLSRTAVHRQSPRHLFVRHPVLAQSGFFVRFPAPLIPCTEDFLPCSTSRTMLLAKNATSRLNCSRRTPSLICRALTVHAWLARMLPARLTCQKSQLPNLSPSTLSVNGFTHRLPKRYSLLCQQGGEPT